MDSKLVEIKIIKKKYEREKDTDMAVTIKDVVKMKAFKGTRVLSGVRGNNNKVESVNIMEVPDIIKYTNQNALLFTTLYPIRNDTEALRNFIPDLSKNNLSGVAIKLGRYIQEVPEYMIRQSNELDFPILILPEEANFSELTNKILVGLLGMKTSILEFRETITQQYQELLLTGGNIDKFVELTSKNIKSEVLILQKDMQLIKGSTQLIEEKYIDRKKEYIDYRKYINDDINTLRKDLARLFFRKKIDIHPVISGKNLLGYMIVLPEPSDVTKKQYHVVVEQAIILLAFLFQSQKNIKQTEKNYLDSFVRDIINGKNIKQEEVIEKAKVFNWKLNFPVKLMSIRISNIDKNNKFNIYNQILDSREIDNTILNILEIKKENLKGMFFNGEILFFINLKSEENKKNKLYETAVQLINNFQKSLDFQISISTLIKDIKDLEEEYQNLHLVHDIYGDNKNNKKYAVFYDDLGIYKFFHAIPQKQIMHDYVAETIGKIIDEDKNKNSELLYTLEILIKNNMSIKNAADELFIHNNSLRYRMNLIKDLGIDLEDGYELSEISIAIKMNDYLKLISI